MKRGDFVKWMMLSTLVVDACTYILKPDIDFICFAIATQIVTYAFLFLLYVTVYFMVVNILDEEERREREAKRKFDETFKRNM